MVLALVVAALGFGSAAAATRESQASRLGPPPAQSIPQAQPGGAQRADPLSPFEYAINSVIGRSLNVPGAD